MSAQGSEAAVSEPAASEPAVSEDGFNEEQPVQMLPMYKVVYFADLSPRLIKLNPECSVGVDDSVPLPENDMKDYKIEFPSSSQDTICSMLLYSLGGLLGLCVSFCLFTAKAC
jgi:hypothetical protein